MLLGCALPLQVENPTTEVREEVRYETVDEVRREMARRGLNLDVMLRILQERAEVDDEGVKTVDAKE